MKFGEEARNELVKLIGGKCVTIFMYGMDQYGRHLGDVYCDGIFIQVRQKILIQFIHLAIVCSSIGYRRK
jgi:hypothetical protein